MFIDIYRLLSDFGANTVICALFAPGSKYAGLAAIIIRSCQVLMLKLGFASFTSAGIL